MGSNLEYPGEKNPILTRRWYAGTTWGKKKPYHNKTLAPIKQQATIFEEWWERKKRNMTTPRVVWLFSTIKPCNRKRNRKEKRVGRDEIWGESTCQQTLQFLLIVYSLGKVSLLLRQTSEPKFWTTGNNPHYTCDITDSHCRKNYKENFLEMSITFFQPRPRDWQKFSLFFSYQDVFLQLSANINQHLILFWVHWQPEL